MAFDPYAAANLGLTYLDATISSRAPANTALSNTVWTDAKAAFLDAAISSRLAASSYVAPDNASISAIKTQTDKLQFDSNNYVYAVGVGGGGGTDWTDDEKKQIRYRLGIDGTTASPQSNTPHLGSTYSTLDDLAAHVSTRLAASSYIAPDNASIAAIKSQTDKLSFVGSDVKATLDNEQVTVAVNNDKTGYSLTADYDRAKTALAITEYIAPDNASIAAIKSQTDKFSFAGTGPYDVKATLDGETVSVGDKTGFSLTSAYDRAKNALSYTEYTAPDNTSISAIKAKTDLLSFTGTDVKATLDGETVVVATNQDKSGYSLTSAYDRAKDALKYTEYTAPDNASIAAIKAKTDQLSFDSEKVLAKVSDPVSLSSTDVSAIVDGVWDEAISQHTTSGSTGAALNNAGSGSVDTGAIAQAVWQYTTRELTGFSFQVTVGTNLDKAGYSLTTAYDRAKDALKYTEYTAPDNASIAAIKEKTDQLSFDTEKVLAKVSDPVTISSTDVSAIVDGVWDEPAAQHTQTGSTGALLGAAGSGSVDYNTMAQAVWQYTTRELTGFNFQVTVASNLDKNGYALTSAYDRAKDALKYTEYTAPDNTSIAAIKTKTDQLNFDTGKVLAKISDPVSLSSTDVSAIVDGVWDEPAAQHTTSGSTGAALNNAGSGSVDTGAIAQAVWQYTTRELTGFSFQVTVGTNLDKIGYSLTSAYDRAKDALKYTEYTTPPTLQDIVQETAEAVLSSDITQLGTVPTYSLATIIYGSLNFEINGAYMYIKNGGNTTITTRTVEYDPNGYPIKAIKPQT